jgi:PAS domain S-box-containing protein
MGKLCETHIHEAESAACQSEARFQALVRNLPGMIYRYLPGYGGIDAFTYVSSGSRDLFELEPETILENASSLWALVHPDDLKSLQDSVAIAIQHSQDWQWEGRFVTPSGQLKWVQGLSRPDETYEQKSWDGLFIDISDRKRAEAERDQLLTREQAAREQAEVANRIKDEFLAVLSHELRSPLNPILGWSRLLQTRTFSAAKTTEALQIIERNAKLQTELIEDLLDVSRILRGKLNLNVYPVNLVGVIQSAIETARLAAEAKSIQLRPLLEPEVGQVLGDFSRLQQVFWNLLSNAVKFTPAGGQVDIRLEQVGSHAQITITDTGQGIQPHFLPYVFDYFRQADSTTTRTFGGLGLGLAIVRQLVELHGGTIQADSLGVGQGATFTVKLPLRLAQSSLSPDSPASEPSSDVQGVKVLVVDDDLDSREFLVFLLADYGVTVTAVASASEALKALAETQPDILLADIGMPDVDGYMLVRQIRTLPPEAGGQIPAIALTAYAGEFNAQQALAAGFQKHLPKPVEPAELVAAITGLIASHR